MLIKAEQIKNTVGDQEGITINSNFLQIRILYKRIWNEEVLEPETDVCESFFTVSTNPAYLSSSRLWIKKFTNTSNHKSVTVK